MGKPAAVPQARSTMASGVMPNQGRLVAAEAIGGDAIPVLRLRRAAILVTQALLLGSIYYLAARLGLGFRFQNSQIGVVWPASAVLLAALVLAPVTRWWVVLAA